MSLIRNSSVTIIMKLEFSEKKRAQNT